MPDLINSMIENFTMNDFDYLSNTLVPTYPDGLDIEIVKTNALISLEKYNMTDSEREHVTLGLYSRPDKFKISNFISNIDFSLNRWTVDYVEDYEFVKEIFESFKGQEEKFTFSEVVNLLQENPKLRNLKGPEFRNLTLKND